MKKIKEFVKNHKVEFITGGVILVGVAGIVIGRKMPKNVTTMIEKSSNVVDIDEVVKFFNTQSDRQLYGICKQDGGYRIFQFK